MNNKQIHSSEVHHSISKLGMKNQNPEPLYGFANNEIIQDSILIDKEQQKNSNNSILSDAKTKKVQCNPIQLIKIMDETNKFEVNKEGLEILTKIQGKICIISFAGLYRTGKSYSLNLLLNKQQSGFKVDPSINSCTQGLWIWGQPIYIPDKNIHVLLIDSEGSNALDRNSSHDVKIFTLLVILSSILVYNSLGVIDESAIHQLSLCTQLTKYIAFKVNSESNTSELLASITPKFVWLLKDFILELKDKKGNTITSNEYMESCLNENTENSKYSDSNRKIRDSILQFFPHRECRLLVRPVESEKELQSLGSIPFGKLRGVYQEQFTNFKNSLFENPKPKYLFGNPIDGQTLGKLLMQFVEEINAGSVPNISNAWDSVMENKIIEIYELSKGILANKIKELENKELLEDFNLVIDDIKNSILSYYENVKKYINLNDESSIFTILYKKYKALLENEIRKKLDKIKIKSEEESQIFCRQLFKEITNNLTLKIADKQYKLENISDINSEIQKIILTYTEKAKGVAKMKIFIEEIINLENKIINYLQKLHEEEKSKVILQNKIKNMENETENLINIKNKTEKAKPSLYRNPNDEFDEPNVLEYPSNNKKYINKSGSESEEDEVKSTKKVNNEKISNKVNKKNKSNAEMTIKKGSKDKEKNKNKDKDKNIEKLKDRDKDKKEKEKEKHIKKDKKSNLKYINENAPDDACGCNLF